MIVAFLPGVVWTALIPCLVGNVADYPVIYKALQQLLAAALMVCAAHGKSAAKPKMPLQK